MNLARTIALAVCLGCLPNLGWGAA
ncbi:MAG: hypothetical protein JWR69_461, partial [Pedosphaera sp.]|nr:hypothetical protein [Pedosphaera sp.]